MDHGRGLLFDCAEIDITPEIAVALYRDLMVGRLTTGWNPAIDDDEDLAYVASWHEALALLRGYDLACWCPLDQPCHADVLLELANGQV